MKHITLKEMFEILIDCIINQKEQPTFSTCPHCHEPVLPHRVCGNCGYYDGKQVIAKKESENA